MTTDTWRTLCNGRYSKGELFADCVQTFDYALPQRWLQDFADWCESEGNGVDYHMIRATTVWVYAKFDSYPMSVCTEVANAITGFTEYCSGLRPSSVSRREPTAGSELV